MSTDVLALLSRLPGSYAGPQRPEPGPHAVVGVGEGTLAAQLASVLPGVAGNFTRSGTQFVLFSPDGQDAARTYAELAEVAGAAARRVTTGGAAGEVDVLVPGGALSTYHFAQALAYATGHAGDAQEAERLLADLAGRCGPDAGDDNPARTLAWSLWGRAPLLLAAPDAEALPQAWQQLLARIGKTLAVPLTGDPLPVVTGAFEAQHEHGDGRIALLLGDLDPALELSREVLETRIDEVVHLPIPGDTESAYAGQLALWYFGAWVAAYLAERYGLDAGDLPVLARAQAVLAGEETEEHLRAERETTPSRRTGLEDWDDTGAEGNPEDDAWETDDQEED